MYNKMFHSTTNPFNMTSEQLLEFSMNPDQQKIGYDGMLNQYPVLGTKYEPYDPFTELYEESQDAVKGAKNAEFFTAPEYKKPAFQEQDPNEVLISMNVREQADEFRRKHEIINSINSLFNPVSGNTPEERAKNQNINKLLAEIDNFAVQYNLSQKQIETLKTQVLSNHLGEYIQTKNSISKQDNDKAEAEAMDLARGNNNTGDAPIVKDPVNGADENGIRNDVDEEAEVYESDNPGGSGGAAVPGGSQGFGGLESATTPLERQAIKARARQLLDALDGESEVVVASKDAIRRFKSASWDKAFRLFRNPPTSKADTDWERERDSNAVVGFIIRALGYGNMLTAGETSDLKEVLKEAKKLI